MDFDFDFLTLTPKQASEQMLYRGKPLKELSREDLEIALADMYQRKIKAKRAYNRMTGLVPEWP